MKFKFIASTLSMWWVVSCGKSYIERVYRLFQGKHSTSKNHLKTVRGSNRHVSKKSSTMSSHVWQQTRWQQVFSYLYISKVINAFTKAFITYVNCASHSAFTWLQNVITAGKVLACLIIISGGAFCLWQGKIICVWSASIHLIWLEYH